MPCSTSAIRYFSYQQKKAAILIAAIVHKNSSSYWG